MHKCSIFIPAYNCEATLESVIDRIPENAWPEIDKIFVVSYGSKDGVNKVAADLAEKHSKIVVKTSDQNGGYGSVVSDGLKFCMETDANYFVCLHGDGQYPPERIPEFLDYMDAGKIDVLQGSRHKEDTALKGGMPMYKYVAGKVLTRMENRIFGIQMTDYHSGFMFYRRSAVQNTAIEKLSRYFDFDLEFIASSRAANLKVSELAIQAHYGDVNSNLNPILYGLHCLKVMYKYKTGHYHRLSDFDTPTGIQA